MTVEVYVVCGCMARSSEFHLYARESVTDRFGGRSIPEIYIPATFNSYVPLIWIETKTLALKVYWVT